jgi:peptidoglycan/LPS O-acetylase OafA/YrhL
VIVSELASDPTPAEQLRRGLRSPVLDGVRGLACLMVLMHHCGRGRGVSWGARVFHGVSVAGWAGVDLFFVLSGFLITGLLLDARDRAEGPFRFWSRRAFRILPLAYAFLAIVFFSPIWRQEPWHPGIYAEQWWFWLFANNWLVLPKPALDHGVLAHFWSLAIEEQFYLLWPLFTLGLAPRKLETLCLVVLIMSFVFHLAAVALHVDPDLVLSLTPARLDGLVLGAWLALGLRRNRRSLAMLNSHRSRVMAAAALSVLLLLPARGLPVRHPWVLAVGPLGLSLIFTLFLSGLLASPKGFLVRRICEIQPLVVLGRISYGFYVLHAPVVASLRRHWPVADGSLADALGFFTTALLASAAIAAISWFALERPLLRLRPG